MHHSLAGAEQNSKLKSLGAWKTIERDEKLKPFLVIKERKTYVIMEMIIWLMAVNCLCVLEVWLIYRLNESILLNIPLQNISLKYGEVIDYQRRPVEFGQIPSVYGLWAEGFFPFRYNWRTYIQFWCLLRQPEGTKGVFFPSKFNIRGVVAMVWIILMYCVAFTHPRADHASLGLAWSLEKLAH